MLKKIFDPTLFRFLLVGVVNTLVGYGVMFGLYNLAGLHLWGDPGYWISSAANYLVGSVVSFFLNKHFTFRSREKGPGVVLRFAANITVCWLLAYGLAKPAMGALLSGTALSPQLQGNLTMLAGSGLFVLLNYFGQRFFAFRRLKPDVLLNAAIALKGHIPENIPRCGNFLFPASLASRPVNAQLPL